MVAWDTYHICLNNTLPSTMDYDEYEQMRESIKLALDNIHNEYKNKTFLDEINVARVQNGLRPMKAKTDRQYKSSLLRRWEKLPYKRKYRDTFVESELPDLIDLVGVDAYEEMLDRLGNGESRRRVEELLSGTDY